MDEYLTVQELSKIIKYSKQSIYNLVYRGTFIQGIHFLKPSPKKLLFKWSEIKKWMGETSCNNENSDRHEANKTPQSTEPSPSSNPVSLINI